MEKDAAKTERKERERRKDSEGQPPPIPEKVTNRQQLEVTASRTPILPSTWRWKRGLL